MALLFHRRTDFDGLRRAINGPRQRLLNHRVYGMIDTTERLRIFMQAHVFAVWDFMSLAKRLQNDLTCTSVPWVPPRIPVLARFANEVILAEESDRGPDGHPRSHLELYLEAMSDVDASTEQFRLFLLHLRDGAELGDALWQARVPRFIRSFVEETVRTAVSDSTVAVASSFLFGREDLIPEMFERLLPTCGGGELGAPNFAYYLRRHIELDGEEHGPVARVALTSLAGDGWRAWRTAERAAKRALHNRLRLWDGVCEVIEQRERREVGRRAPRTSALMEGTAI
jgi:hypothetical protein